VSGAAAASLRFCMSEHEKPHCLSLAGFATHSAAPSHTHTHAMLRTLPGHATRGWAPAPARPRPRARARPAPRTPPLSAFPPASSSSPNDPDTPVPGDPSVQDGLAAMLRLRIGAEEVKELVAREEEKLIASAEKVRYDREMGWKERGGPRLGAGAALMPLRLSTSLSRSLLSFSSDQGGSGGHGR